MRLKKSVIMFLILFVLLVSMTVGGLIKKHTNENEIPQDEIIEDVVPQTFCGVINNNSLVPDNVLNVIKGYMDDYYKSIYTLELVDTTKYFKNEIDGKVSNAAIRLIVDSRKLYDFDFTMNDAHYDLSIISCNEIDGKYHIVFLEDDYFCFKFLNGISSEAYDIENSMIIEKINNEYKISEYEKVQGYYSMFNESKNEDDISKVYDFYYKRLATVIDNENYQKQVALDKPFISDKSFDVAYNRDKASVYANTYYHSRNENYYDFSDEGGNCQNFASQSLLAGGMIMDESGECEWYFNGYGDYVPSWVHVQSFNDYCKDNEGTGLVSEVDANVYYAEPGDLIQVGISSVSHTTIVSKIVDGHILLNSNSIDMKDFPLEGYTYPVRKLIKILGSNS